MFSCVRFFTPAAQACPPPPNFTSAKIPFVQASDAWFEGDNLYSLGSFYKAYIKLDGKLYYVSVTGGDQPLIYGEQVVSTLAIDKTLQEELIEK